ncbi:MAG: hypothetical protein ACFE7S_06275 [Candidatus Hodarchaeota archaeon]
MLRSLYIFSKSGETLFTKFFGEDEIDEQLFSGFISALFSLAREFGHRGMEIMKMDNLKFFYDFTDKLIFAVSADDGDDETAVKNLLATIRDRFLERYGEALAHWRGGDVSAFKDFEGDIWEITKYGTPPEGSEFFLAPPFSFNRRKLRNAGAGAKNLESDVDVSHSLDSELSTMFIVVEDQRFKGSGFLRKKPAETVDYLSRILWPIWFVKIDEERFIPLDGLAGENLSVPKLDMKNLERIKKTIHNLSLDESVVGLNNIEKTLEGTLDETAITKSLVSFEALKGIRKILPYTKYQSPNLTTAIPSLLSLKESLQIGESLKEALENTHKFSLELEDISKAIDDVTDRWLDEIESNLSSIETKYSGRIEKVEKEVSARISDIEKRKMQELNPIREWRDDERTKIVNEFKVFLLPLEQNFTTLSNLIKTHYQNLSQTEEVQAFLDIVSVYLTQINEGFKETQIVLNEVKDKADHYFEQLKAVDEKTEISEKQVNEKYENMVEEQRKRLSSSEEEKQQTLKEQEDLKKSIIEKKEIVLSKISEIKERCLSEDHRLTGFLLQIPHPLRVQRIFGFHIPLYVAKYLAPRNEARYVVSSPLIFPARKNLKREPYHEQTIPTELFDETMISLKINLERIINERKRLQKIIDTAARKNNFLDMTEIRAIINEGLNKFEKTELISRRDLLRLKTALVEMFRKEGN